MTNEFGFTYAEGVYGVDSNYQLGLRNYNRNQSIDLLKDEFGFTHAQSVYGTDAALGGSDSTWPSVKVGLLKSGSNWYYMDGSGAMQTKSQVINGKRYYFYEDGRMK